MKENEGLYKHLYITKWIQSQLPYHLIKGDADKAMQWSYNLAMILISADLI